MTELASPDEGKVTPQLTCGTLAGILISESERFLDLVAGFLRARADSTANQDLVTFVTHADSFATTCCTRIAAELKETSTQAEVRETADRVLARLLRNRCFDSLDTVLAAYVEVLRGLSVDVKPTLTQMADSKVKELGLAAGAPGNASSAESPRAGSLNNKNKSLLLIWEYLKVFATLPSEVMDYGSLKALGPDVDYQLQKNYVQNVLDAIHAKYEVTLAAIEGFEAVREKKWSQSRAEEDAAIKGVALAATRQAGRKKSSTGSLVIGALCVAPIIGVATSGIDSPPMLIGGIVLGMVGVFFFFRAVSNFLDA